MDENQSLVMGVDAGATRVRVAIADMSGRVLGRGEGGAGNALSVPLPELTSHLRDAIGAAAVGAEGVGTEGVGTEGVGTEAGVAGRVRAVVAGFAGAVSLAVDPDDTGRQRAHAALAAACADVGIPPGATIDVRSDVEVAFASGAGPSRDGLVLVCGSGAVGGRLADGRLVWTADGHGRLIDDAGSGFWIGRGAMRAVLRALDGRAPWTTLVDAVTERLGVTAGPDVLSRSLAPTAAIEEVVGANDREGGGRGGGRGRERGGAGPEVVALRRAVIRAVASRDEFYLSTLCPLVTRAAADGDRVANELLDEAVAELIATVRALRPEPGEPLVTTGGLLGPDGPLLPRLTAAIRELGLTPVPVEDGVAGGVTLARG
jgi:glucosamine kinase